MEALILPFSYIAEGLQQNAVPFELAHGESLWEHLKRKPDLEHEFSLAMASQDKLGIHAVLTDYDWAQHSRVIDVGAAYGTFLVAILQRNSKQKGTLCDLPQVVQRAEKQWRSLYSDGMMSRTSFVGCNFLQSGMLPKATQDKEAYVLRDILHDWADDKVLIILRNLRQAIGDNNSAVVLLVETLLPGALAGTEPSMKHLLDITMLVSVDGKERTKQEFHHLLQQTGFVLKAIHATRGLYKVIEAVPDSTL